MTVKKITTCDRCEASTEDFPKLAFWRIGIIFGHDECTSTLKESMSDWCEDCCKEFNLIGTAKITPPPKPLPGTILAELLRWRKKS